MKLYTVLVLRPLHDEPDTYLTTVEARDPARACVAAVEECMDVDRCGALDGDADYHVLLCVEGSHQDLTPAMYQPAWSA